MSPSNPSPVSAEPPRPRFRLPHWGWFLLATVALVIGIVALSVWLPWHREQRVIKEFHRIGGWDWWAETQTGGPEWMRQVFSEDRIKSFKVFERVVGVELQGTEINDADIAQLSGLTNLKYLHLDGTAVTDAGLANLAALVNLDTLSLDDTKVTDVGLAHMTKLANLEALSLEATEVTDAGLAQLRGLTKLRVVYVTGTSVTEKGIEELKAALPGCEIENISPRQQYSARPHTL